MSEPIHSEGPTKVSETIILITGLVLFLVLIYFLVPILSPFLLVGAILFLLYPFRSHLFARRLMLLAVLIFLIWLLSSLSGVLAPFIIAFLFAYIFNPLVNYFERQRLQRWLSSLIVIVLILGIIVALFIVMIPVIVTQSGGIIQSVSGFVQNTIELIKSGWLVDFLARLGIPAPQVQEFLSQQLPSRMEGILKSVLEAMVGFLTNASAIVSQLLNLIIIPFVAFYLLKDYPKIFAGLQSVIPVERREAVNHYFSKVDDMLGQYLRGVLVIALIQGSLTTIGLLVLGIQYALMLGMITGILNLIPYVGFYSSLVFAIIAALFSGDPIAFKVISVILLYVGLNFLETTVFSPKIVGSKVGLHPVVLILSLVVFGYFLGFVGLLIAVPVTAIIIMTAKMWIEAERMRTATLADLK